jgi:HEPN domain-containing protein
MKAETQEWLSYASENARAAEALARDKLYNACLQNCQQSVEKALKAAITEFGLEFTKTHSIAQLCEMLGKSGRSIDVADEDVELLDAIYLPSKYPVASVLPTYEPDEAICARCVAIAAKVEKKVRGLVVG